ncbi:uncharacterized protein TRAVEDRAFT_21881 [Trametes versicolor FP-101664 SS1]|uniref:uncharacterized protein n=1 Tax=Trametes versicolor (strain FP-101664) TaxID=717944 RepID=UPI000462421F|nr:uncharacterized protein TRAVEDRAFT_21881 [Trametes versicolor FP-101664 SS1]EIW56943.1 hypothetical protein TRAVEDRAFT_21881 [Trametes versicolor FP-101664 SS1]
MFGLALAIYRLFIVWNRSKKVIVVPATLCLVNAVCGYLTLGPLTTTFILLGFILLSLVSNVLCSVLIIWRVFRSANHSTPFSARFKLYQKVAEAIVQSAAIYSTASIALGLTFFFNPNNKPGFLVCLAVFPPLIGLVFSFIVLRMARTSAEDAARRSSHTGNDKRHTIIAPNRRSMSVQLHMPPFPPPAFHLATLDFPEDARVTDSSNASTNTVKPVNPLTRNNTSLAEDLGLEGPPGGNDLDVLDVRTSKSSWSDSGGLR